MSSQLERFTEQSETLNAILVTELWDLKAVEAMPVNLLEPDMAPPVMSVPYIAPLKTGRNEPFPCGSGKKYKKCCGA